MYSHITLFTRSFYTCRIFTFKKHLKDSIMNKSNLQTLMWLFTKHIIFQMLLKYTPLCAVQHYSCLLLILLSPCLTFVRHGLLGAKRKIKSKSYPVITSQDLLQCLWGNCNIQSYSNPQTGIAAIMRQLVWVTCSHVIWCLLCVVYWGGTNASASVEQNREPGEAAESTKSRRHFAKQRHKYAAVIFWLE